MSEYKTLCHGKCKTEKDNFLFSPGQLNTKWPVCRGCMKQTNQKRQENRRTNAPPPVGGFGDTFSFRRANGED